MLNLFLGTGHGENDKDGRELGSWLEEGAERAKEEPLEQKIKKYIRIKSEPCLGEAGSKCFVKQLRNS